MGRKGKSKQKVGSAVPISAPLPLFTEVDSLLSALRTTPTSFQSPPHTVSLNQDNLLCLSTTFAEYQLRDLEKWAEVLNTVNSKGCGSFFVLSEGALTLRTASVCSADEEERAQQTRQIVIVHNENMGKYLGMFEGMKRL
jgi:hypothetical protein